MNVVESANEKQTINMKGFHFFKDCENIHYTNQKCCAMIEVTKEKQKLPMDKPESEKIHITP
ncbi:hypothetical protein [Paenibacillus sp. YSY-4.3]